MKTTRTILVALLALFVMSGCSGYEDSHGNRIPVKSKADMDRVEKFCSSRGGIDFVIRQKHGTSFHCKNGEHTH